MDYASGSCLSPTRQIQILREQYHAYFASFNILKIPDEYTTHPLFVCLSALAFFIYRSKLKKGMQQISPLLQLRLLEKRDMTVFCEG